MRITSARREVVPMREDRRTGPSQHCKHRARHNVESFRNRRSCLWLGHTRREHIREVGVHRPIAR